MTTESNKAFMQRFTQFINTASEELAGELISAAQARSFSIGWRRPLACDGSTSAAAAVPLPSCSWNDVRQPRFRGLIRLRRSYLLRAHDLPVG
jgi:hypothetical protein